MDKTESVILTVRKGSIMTELNSRAKPALLDAFHVLTPQHVPHVKSQGSSTSANA